MITDKKLDELERDARLGMIFAKNGNERNFPLLRCIESMGGLIAEIRRLRGRAG